MHEHDNLEWIHGNINDALQLLSAISYQTVSVSWRWSKGKLDQTASLYKNSHCPRQWEEPSACSNPLSDITSEEHLKILLRILYTNFKITSLIHLWEYTIYVSCKGTYACAWLRRLTCGDWVDMVANVDSSDCRCRCVGKIIARDLRLVASRLYNTGVTRPWTRHVQPCRYMFIQIDTISIRTPDGRRNFRQSNPRFQWVALNPHLWRCFSLHDFCRYQWWTSLVSCCRIATFWRVFQRTTLDRHRQVVSYS